MTTPTKPLNLSADATNSTTASLVWSTPSSDGGKPITSYTVQRKLPQVVLSFTVSPVGTGYSSVSPPSVTVSGGGGIGATGVAVITGGTVSAINVTSGGNGFTSAPDVTIDPPPSGTQAEATANLSTTGFDNIGTTSFTVKVFSDETLFPRDNPIYQITATNEDGESNPSDTASTTTATSEAQTIAELLFDGWNLTGELSKTVTTTDPPMTEPVHFFDRGQVPGNKFAKSITVQKINALGNENIVEHPRFFEESNTFEITCFLQVIDSADDQFSVWVDLMQQMTTKVTDILRGEFAPSNKKGVFFRTNTNWTRDDTFFPDDPELVRTLRFVLTRIKSNDPAVFVGYPGALPNGTSGVLVLSVASSVADNLPTTNHTYFQTERIQVVYGWRNIPYLTASTVSTIGTPIYYRGQFSGQFSCDMYLDKDDITPVTFDSLAQLVLPQSNGELGRAAFLVSNANVESTPVVLNQLVSVNITSFEKISENEELIKINIRGNLVEPSTFSVGVILVKMVYEDGTPLAAGGNVGIGEDMAYQIPAKEIMGFEPSTV